MRPLIVLGLSALALAVAGNADSMAAVEALTTYRPDKPLATMWTDLCTPGKDLNRIDVTAKLVTVHFDDQGGATCDLSEQGMIALQQQLAWTVRTATGSNAPVQVTTRT